MEYYAHSREDENGTIYQTVSQHANGVAEKVVEFSKGFCQDHFAKAIALLHDIGKYQESFQLRIRGKDIAVPHAICGAKEWTKYFLPDAVAYIIAGHHAGLYDRGNDSSPYGLLFRLKHDETEDYSAYEKDISISENKGCIAPCGDAVSSYGETAWKEYAFWIRMMFSCLVDADFLDTEEFCSNGTVDRSVNADLDHCLKILRERLISLQKSSVTETEKARRILLEQVLSRKDVDANFYYMNMPTGSGKTLASMNFALERAIAKGKKRIIYVIPYTSIIEQNAKVFKDLFGEDIVLEHHCNFDHDSYDDTSTKEKMMRMSENWDAPIIVTTNVQFFESIYSNRTSRVRKLHNIANSILIFDEAHMLPSGFFQPCLEAVKILTSKYGCEAIFLTATMPDFDEWLKTFKCDGILTCDLIKDTSCFESFKRSAIENIGAVSEEALLERVAEYKNALVVVNERKRARSLYEMYSGKKYHLSTYMSHFDRARVIEQIKISLAKDEEFCLFSTSLIEAGVDLDFDSVFREQAGLDNLLQTAGRCNRNGKKAPSECKTHSFRFEDGSKTMAVKSYYTQETFERYEDVTSPQAIRFYFDKLYSDEKEKMSANDFLFATPSEGGADFSGKAKRFKLENVYSKLSYFNFAGYAEKFHLIDDHTKPLLIINSQNREYAEKLLEELKYSLYGKSIRRKLQKYIISLRPYEFNELSDHGVIQNISGIDCLMNENYYNTETGICFEDTEDYIF